MVYISKDCRSHNLIYMELTMGKMSKRRRKKKKKKNSLAKFMESLSFFKPRMGITPVGYAFKSKKEYNRSENKKIIDNELDD